MKLNQQNTVYNIRLGDRRELPIKYTPGNKLKLVTQRFVHIIVGSVGLIEQKSKGCVEQIAQMSPYHHPKNLISLFKRKKINLLSHKLNYMYKPIAIKHIETRPYRLPGGSVLM